MNELLEELVRTALAKGLSVEVSLSEDGRQNLVFNIIGFYKSGHLSLSSRKVLTALDSGGPAGAVSAVARYNERHLITTGWDEIVQINYQWWIRSRKKYDGWSQPEPGFLPDFVRLGLVEKEEHVTYAPVEP